MAFKGITFAGQNVTPKNDGGLYQAHYGDGILWGCSMNISGDDLVIQSGEFIAGGRVCQVDGATPVDLSLRTLTNGFIQVVMDFDVSKPEGEQWNIHTPLIESATTTFPALTKDEINNNGTLYQVELATVQISGGNLTSIYSTLDWSVVLQDSPSGVKGYMRADTDGAYIRVIDSADNFLGGYFAGVDGTNIMYGENGNLYFRPLGRSSVTGEVFIDTNGQVNGGHKYVEKDRTSISVSVGGTWTSIDSVNLEAGIWDISASIGVYGLNANRSITLNIANNSGDATCRNTIFLNAPTANVLYNGVSRIMNLNATTTIYIWGQSDGSATVQQSHIRAVRIG